MKYGYGSFRNGMMRNTPKKVLLSTLFANIDGYKNC